jgi:hypothetical protein
MRLAPLFVMTCSAALLSSALLAPVPVFADNSGAPAAVTGDVFGGSSVGSDGKPASGPPPLDEYNNVPTNMMIPEQAVVKDADGNDVVESHLNEGTRTGYDQLLKLYQEGKYEDVAKGLEPLAKVDHHGAQELLGIMYEEGQGVTKDPHKAYDWLIKAADANRPLAQHHLGVMYYQGDGVAKDPIVALMWLHIAIVHYTDGPEKTRAVKDRDAIYTTLTRREKERAVTLAKEWLGKKGESELMDLQTP